MWGSLQLDWPFFLIVVVVIITSCSALPPQMIVSTALLRVCLSVTVVEYLLYVAATRSSRFCVAPLLPPHNFSAPICSVSYLSLSSVSCLRGQKHGAFLNTSHRCHSPAVIFIYQYPLLCFLFFLKQEVVLLFSAWSCLVSSHPMCPVTGTSVGWPWSLGFLVSGVLTPSPAPFSFVLYLFYPFKLPCPPIRYCGFVACIWSISTLQFSLGLLYNTVLHCMSLQTCHVGLSWFSFMFCCNNVVLYTVLTCKMLFPKRNYCPYSSKLWADLMSYFFWFSPSLDSSRK